MSRSSFAALPGLREELHALVQQTMTLASSTRFAFVEDTNGRQRTALVCDAAQAATAGALHDRLQRWQRTVHALLRRSAADADDLSRLIDDFAVYVQMRRNADIATLESEWRRDFETEIDACRRALERLLDRCDDATESEKDVPAPAIEWIDVFVEWLPFEVRIRSHGEAWTFFDTDAPDLGKCREFSRKLTAREGLSNSFHDVAEELGRDLYDCVFPPPVAGRVLRMRDEARERNVVVGIRFRLGHAGPFEAIPWELLHDGHDFLSLRRDVAVCRATEARDGTHETPRNGALRVLVTAAAPASLRHLDSAREKALLDRALAPLEFTGRVRRTLSPGGSLDGLRRAIRAARSVDVWHFIGHGREDEGGALAFADEHNSPQWVRAAQLHVVWAGPSPPRLVVLNACHAGSTSIPRTLLDLGVEAVIAMQFPISDHAAIAFSEELYATIADGAPLSVALTDARRAIHSVAAGIEWLTPMLVTAVRPGRELPSMDVLS